MKYAALLCLLAIACVAADYPPPKEGDFTTRNFKFKSGESLPELRMHYATLGTAKRDGRGQVTNAVLILHGTGGSWKQFMQPQFANELFGPGQPLDATRYYIVITDNIGHGGSSKPSNGLHMRFPKYDYDDMVAAQHLLLTEGLGVGHLRLIFGTSMGCMHSFVWGETYPEFMDALMPMACQTVQIAGRNRMWRKAVIDSIELDPGWNNGEYKEEPTNGLRSATYILAIAGSAPIAWQALYPTRDAADKFVVETVEPRVKSLDANDMIYQFDASRNYNPSPNLEKIRAPLMWINTTDDFINPPELTTPESEVKRMAHGQFHLLQASKDTRGHGTHTWAVFWKQYMVELLQETEKK
jgi:homoserine O-acetyltransferase